MAIWTQVIGLRDGTDSVDAESLNKPLYQLKERTDYLYQQLQALLGSGTFESLRIPNVPLDTTNTPVGAR